MKKSVQILGFLALSLFVVYSCSDDEECTQTTWYQDADGDGLGNPAVTLSACDQPSGYVSNNTDDDDVCSGTVDACGVCDGSGEIIWYQDADGDGLGNPDVSQSSCTQPADYVMDNTDTDDTGSGGAGCTWSSGDGDTAPCGAYDGVYSNDYEYVDGLGALDEANGRTGITPEYPDGTYYYIITDEFPSLPRYFRGTPSEDFAIGG